MDTNLSAWIELSVWRSKRCHEHSMVKFVSTRVYLIPHTCVCITEQVWALEGCISANFPNYILSRDRDEGFVSNGSKDVSHDNKIYSCIMEVPNKSASFVVIFVLFCFHLGRICDLCFKQKCWKSFYSLDKNILFSYEIIRGIQQVTSISFFPSVGNQSGNERKHILHSWVADQSTAFLLAHGSHLNV